jgi:NitT/TauT family transport system substrate-binding protein
MKPRTLVVAGLIPVLLAAAGCGTKAPNASGGKKLDKVTLTLNWYPYGEHAPLYYGKKRGIYAKYGIDLTIQAGQGSGKTVQATAAGQTDLGWADTSAVLAGVTQGLKVKSVGVFLQITPASVQFFADKNITTPMDLKGKTIATTAGDALSRTFPAFLKANGLTQSDVTLQNTDAAGKIAAVISGKTDALLGNATDQGPTIQEKAAKTVSSLKFADYGLSFLSDGLVASDTILSGRRDLVQRMVAATGEAWTKAKDDVPGAVAAMAGASQQLPSTQVLTRQLTATLLLLHTNMTTGQAPGVDNTADWARTIGIFVQAGVIAKAEDPDAYWDSSFARKE